MKLIATDDLQPGMVLGENVVSHGNLFCPAGTELSPFLIKEFKRCSVLRAAIMEEVDYAKTHFEKIRFDESFLRFETVYNTVLMNYKSVMLSYLQTGIQVPDQVLFGFYDEINKTIPSGAKLLDYLYNMMPNEDELTFTQCLNAALFSGTVSGLINMDEHSKRILILCGFYYDIGKLQLPYQLLWKRGKLTPEEFNIMKTHPIVGYNMVCRLNLNEHVKNAVIMHHERLDGSGYPYRLEGQRIDVYARYIAIVDAYIAMASPRSYRNALTPLQILGNFEGDLSKFDIELLMPVMKKIADAQIGSRIQTNDGKVWEVLIIHNHKLSRPVLMGDKREVLDLLEHPELEIVKMV